MLPWEIARLTDHQIIHNYVLPSAARAEALRRRAAGQAPLPEPGDEEPAAADAPPDRRVMIGVMMSMLGMTKEQAVAEYEAQARLNAAQKRKES